MAACGTLWKCGYVDKSVDNLEKNVEKRLKNAPPWITLRHVDIFAETLGRGKEYMVQAPTVFHPPESLLT